MMKTIARKRVKSKKCNNFSHVGEMVKTTILSKTSIITLIRIEKT